MWDITESRRLFAAERIAFWIDGPWLRGLFRQMSGFKRDFDSHYGAAKIPVGPSGRSESILYNHSLAISADCTHVESAYKWIEFLTTEEVSVRCHLRTLSMLPPLRDFLHTPFFAEEPFCAVCIDQIDTVSSFPVGHSLFIKSILFISQVVSGIITDSRVPAERRAFLKEIVQIINQNGGSYSSSFGTARPRAAALRERTAPEEWPNTNAEPPASTASAWMSSTSRSTAYGALSPLSPLFSDGRQTV